MERPAPRSRSVLTLGAPPEGRGVVLSAAEHPPCFGALDLDAVARLAAEVHDALAPRGLLVPDEDAAYGAAERRIGRGLAELLQGPELREVSRRLEGSRARAALNGEPLDLLLDLRDPALFSLPWELLELIPAGEPLGGCRVARLMDGVELTVEDGGGLEVQIWSPTPEDPDCARVEAALNATLGTLPNVRRARADEPPGDGPWRILHVICHGGARGEPVLELGQQRALDAATLALVLKPRVEGAALVVLDVCGAAAGDEPAALPAWRVVDAGAAACLAPRAALDVEASIAMSGALYAALSAGEPLMDAVRASRRQVAALGLPDPSARWWTLTLVTSAPAVLDLTPLRGPSPVIPGLDRAAPDAAAVLTRAAELASTQGFFGLEHLALALSRLAEPPPLIALAQPHLLAIAARAASFQPTGAGEARVSPRLRALLEALPEGFDLHALVAAVASSRPFRLEAPGLSGLTRIGGLTAKTLSGDEPLARPTRAAGSPADGLCVEVLGGPEDGLQHTLTTSQPVLGRWDPQAPRPEVSALFAHAGATDASVSRRHLRWHGCGRVEALAAAALRRDGAIRAIRGAETLRVGDVLDLGRGTRVEIVSVPD